MGRLNIGSLWQGLTGDKDGAGDRIVPPTGFTAQLTLFSACLLYTSPSPRD